MSNKSSNIKLTEERFEKNARNSEIHNETPFEFIEKHGKPDMKDFVEIARKSLEKSEPIICKKEPSLCAICNQPVLYSELGGVNKDKEGKIRVFHEECIIKEKEGYKITSVPAEKPLSDNEITNLRKLLEAYLTIEQKGWLNTIIEEARKQAATETQKQFEKRFLEEYNKIREHRGNCPSWKAWREGMSAKICLDCFGGGLTKFTEKLKEGIK